MATRQIPVSESAGAGLQAFSTANVTVAVESSGRAHAMVGCLTETVPVASFTDGGAAAGTYQMVGSVPAGSILLGSKVLVPAGFAGDTSAALTIGDGSDVDRYNTGTPSVFTTAATGVECGVPSGSKLIITENRPTLTVTSAADFTAVKSNGSGSVTVSIYFIPA